MKYDRCWSWQKQPVDCILGCQWEAPPRTESAHLKAFCSLLSSAFLPWSAEPIWHADRWSWAFAFCWLASLLGTSPYLSPWGSGEGDIPTPHHPGICMWWPSLANQSTLSLDMVIVSEIGMWLKMWYWEPSPELSKELWERGSLLLRII